MGGGLTSNTGVTNISCHWFYSWSLRLTVVLGSYNLSIDVTVMCWVGALDLGCEKFTQEDINKTAPKNSVFLEYMHRPASLGYKQFS